MKSEVVPSAHSNRRSEVVHSYPITSVTVVSVVVQLLFKVSKLIGEVPSHK